MPPHVNITRIRPKLETVDEAQVRDELSRVFAGEAEVTAYQVLTGFEENQDRKLILAVETTSKGPPTSGASISASAACRLHIVKLGWKSRVAVDHDRWNECCRGRKISMRMFVPTHPCDFGQGKTEPRAAVVYEDASQLFGPLSDGEQISSLGAAFNRAVLHHDDVSVASVERILRQVYAELGRWFYHSERCSRDLGLAFFEDKLRLKPNAGPNVFALWDADKMQRLRADAIWLLFDQRRPDGKQQPDYLDPVEFLTWAFRSPVNRIPTTLVSASHGDLHGFNVLLGVSCGEAEYPVIIDYGDMSRENAVVWDFVKMETEIKVRLLHDLFEQQSVRQEVWQSAVLPHHVKLAARWLNSPTSHRPHERSQHILFAFLFERLLAQRAADAVISQRHDSPIKTPAMESPLLRALTLLSRIRLEAAHHLGRHGDTWAQEYDFALAAYGVATAKFGDRTYPELQRAYALVSAGAAAARLPDAQRAIADQMAPAQHVDPTAATGPNGPSVLKSDWPGFCVPLRQAYVSWTRHKDLELARELLKLAAGQFPHAVPLARELALLLAANGKSDEALRVLNGLVAWRSASPTTNSFEPLIALCESFGDYETLSRIGRAYKDLGDAAWEATAPILPFERLAEIAASQWYLSAYDFYSAAFTFSHEHFPGGNAAVTALLAGRKQESLALAADVARQCQQIRLGQLPAEEQYWVLCTEATMALLMGEGDSQGAERFLREALLRLPAGNHGYVQPTYDQLCRLYHALGAAAVLPVATQIATSFAAVLDDGPLGDCGGLLSKYRLGTTGQSSNYTAPPRSQHQ